MSEWISVDDRLPENSLVDRVIVGRTEESGIPSSMEALFLDGKFMCPSMLRGELSEYINPTHWQPMPEPPK